MLTDKQIAALDLEDLACRAGFGANNRRTFAVRFVAFAKLVIERWEQIRGQGQNQ